jgi:hypothetical protein
MSTGIARALAGISDGTTLFCYASTSRCSAIPWFRVRLPAESLDKRERSHSLLLLSPSATIAIGADLWRNRRRMDKAGALAIIALQRRRKLVHWGLVAGYDAWERPDETRPATPYLNGYNQAHFSRGNSATEASYGVSAPV